MHMTCGQPVLYRLSKSTVACPKGKPPELWSKPEVDIFAVLKTIHPEREVSSHTNTLGHLFSVSREACKCTAVMRNSFECFGIKVLGTFTAGLTTFFDRYS